MCPLQFKAHAERRINLERPRANLKREASSGRRIRCRWTNIPSPFRAREQGVDRTLILWCSGHPQASKSTRNYPIQIVGGNKLGFKHGKLHAFEGDKKVPLANLSVSMLNAVDVPVDSFADSAGPMTELTGWPNYLRRRSSISMPRPPSSALEGSGMATPSTTMPVKRMFCWKLVSVVSKSKLMVS